MSLSKGFIGFTIVLIIGGIVGLSSVFIVTEGQQAVVLRFGKPVENPSYEKPGIKFKVPLIDEVLYLEKRILSWDGKPTQIPTKDKKYII